MRIGLICPDVPGHLNPLTCLGRELADRGHLVSVFGLEMGRAIVEHAGLAFVSLDQPDDSIARAEELWAKLAASSNIQSMIYTGQIFGLITKIHNKFLAETLTQHAIEGLVVDQLSPAAYLIAKQRNIPCAIASNALAMYWDPLMPPPPLPWAYRTDWIGRFRNRLAGKLIPIAYYRFAEVKSTGVDPLMLVWDSGQGLVQVAQQPAFFDFPRQNTLTHFHYTGPWHRADRDDGRYDFPWDWLDGRPLIYASMGTLQNRLQQVFRSIIEAVKELPMQVVLSKGGGRVEMDGPLPENVLAVDIAPQLRLLERASLAITHAGLNTALECLTCGVPMLCLPVTNDQPGVGKRVEWIGAGRTVQASRATTPRIRKELTELLSNPRYRVQAEYAQQRLSAIHGLTLAADLIERALTTRTRIPSISEVNANEEPLRSPLTLAPPTRQRGE